MENASKALIIAGAILISILIIGLGMTVYNNASSSTSNANLDQHEIRAHNSQFLSYEGKQKGSQVTALINSMKTNNAKYEDRQIYLNASLTSAEPTSTPKKATPSSTFEKVKASFDSYGTVKPNTTYYVTFGYSDNGCISGCEIHIYSDECGTSDENIEFTDLT